MQKINFAIVGCGHIGKRHAEMVLRNVHCNLVAMIDTNVDLHADLHSKFQVPVFSTIDDFNASNISTDIVVIATPNGTHHTLAIDALKHQHHIVVEKPMSLKSAHCQLMIDEAQKQHKHIFCVMQNRYSPPSVWLKSVVESGILGNIYLVQINCFWNRDERYYTANHWKGTMALDGGTLYTQFSHFIDMMYWLFGDIDHIHAEFEDLNHQKTTEFEDTGIINFKFNRGGMGNFNFTTSVYNKNLESSMTIIAENGTIKVGGQYMDTVTNCDIKDYTMPKLAETNPANDYGYYKGSAANHHYIIENIVNVLTQNGHIHIPANDGLKVVEIIERMYLASKKN